MPRKEYASDLDAARAANIGNVSNILVGEESGQFSFDLNLEDTALTLSFSALLDVSDYPKSHSYVIFAADDVDPRWATRLSALPRTSGLRISPFLELVRDHFCNISPSDKDVDVSMRDSPDLGETDDEFEESEDEDQFDDDDMFSIHDMDGSATLNNEYTSVHGETNVSNFVPRSFIQADLFITKNAGFKVGYYGRIEDGQACYVTISCRSSKLGISTEAMQAWQLDPSDYLILLIHYPYGYTVLKDIVASVSRDDKCATFRVGKKRGMYKPTYEECRNAFNRHRKANEEDAACNEDQQLWIFQDTFISKSMNNLLNDRLVIILSYRCNDMTWQDAETLFDKRQGKIGDAGDSQTEHCSHPEETHADLPALLTDDHMTEQRPKTGHSFPLLSMQFLIRHFARCTEFCLVCHCKLPEGLEALKPYVCDKSLCLYQYLNFGFGPTIEHEIRSQPQVVDLLISFCYSRARSMRLQDFPLGLGIQVPYSESLAKGQTDQNNALTPSNALIGSNPPPYESVKESLPTMLPKPPIYQVKFNLPNREILFPAEAETSPFRVGQWMSLKIDQDDLEHGTMHCCVAEVLFPVVKIHEPVMRLNPEAKERKAPADAWASATTWPFDISFDTLQQAQKCLAICDILDFLPSIQEMREYLGRNQINDINSWRSRMSPASASVLRWILASNRACILQVDKLVSEEEGNMKAVALGDRVHGMQNWLQFRFAMGAPDKERRFIKCVSQKSMALKQQYPTIFAFHGSPLGNWHSIIREGLHFKDLAHGRAYGNGCYHAMESSTSMGYSSYRYGAQQDAWPRSALQIQSAVSLNQIVNAPLDFVSAKPFLVVSQLDWIQTRYLFVKCNAKITFPDEEPPKAVTLQDPDYTPKGIANTSLVIPASVVSRSRKASTGAKRQTQTKSSRPSKSPKLDNLQFESSVEDGNDEDDASSIRTDAADLQIFEEEDKIHSNQDTQRQSGKIYANRPSNIMDFQPGALDHSMLKSLEPPDFATPFGTKRLMQDLGALVKIQKEHPLHELGWSIDEQAFDNVYQWIIEMHSFERSLPLAKQMEEKGIQSVVLEFRFGKDYPHSPPFVRVIRPRFLGFQSGGGGNVTIGGALCMELLTNNGWSAVSSIESVLLQIRMAICDRERPAQLAPGNNTDYGTGEAVQAYLRACVAHGWTPPPGLKETAAGSSQPAP